MTRTVEITDEMIRAGSPQSDTDCPVGLALRAAGLIPVCVGFNFISFSVDDRIQTAAMPREVAKFLRSYDAAKAVRPLRFRLTLIDEQRRPLPARTLRRSMPAAPPLPASAARPRAGGFRKAIASFATFFGI